MIKNFFLLVVFLFYATTVGAQDFSKVTINTVWYQTDTLIKQIYPINTLGMEMKGTFKKKVKLVYKGSSANVKVKDITLYAYANTNYMQSPANFCIIPLIPEKDKRTYLWLSASMFKAKSNDDFIPITYENISENVFKISPKVKLAPGEYGFIYNISGMPTTIFDFTIIE